MNPTDILRMAYAADVEISIAQSGNLFVKPADRLTPALRELLVANKPALIEFLYDAENTVAVLITAAMRACDHWGDAETAREQMRRDCLDTPPELRADLLGHFRSTYPRKEGTP